MSIYKIQYDAPPVVSIRINPKDPHDIDKLVDEISQVVKTDNILTYRMDKGSKAFILMGIDIFHLEILAKRINEQVNIDIEKPQVIYRERISKKSKQFSAKSANGLNEILLFVEPIDDKTEDLILLGKINELQYIEERAAILCDEANWDPEEARKVIDVYQGCLLINGTSGLEKFDQVKSSLVNAFRDWIRECIIAKEPATEIKVIITNLVIHDDPRPPQYGQIAGMTICALSFAMLDAEPHLFEPIHEFELKIPDTFKENLTKTIRTHRGKILNTFQDDNKITIKGLMPTAELITIINKIQDATQDSGFFHDGFLNYEKMTPPLEVKTILKIRERKKLPLELPETTSWDFIIEQADPAMKSMRKKVISTIAEQEVELLVLDRKYLLELIDESFCDLYSDFLPKLNDIFEFFLKLTGISVRYEGTMIKFFKLPFFKSL